MSCQSVQHGLVLITMYVDNIQVAAARTVRVWYFKGNAFCLQTDIARDRVNQKLLLSKAGQKQPPRTDWTEYCTSRVHSLQYTRQLFGQCGFRPGHIPVGIHNEAAIRLNNDPNSAARTQHIDVVHHHIRGSVRMGHFQFAAVPSKDKPSDVITNPLPCQLLQKHRR